MNKPESEMVLVPREPTPEMMVAVDDAYGDGGDFPDMWEAAIAAAPTMPIAADFEAWLRTVCFQKPTPEAYDLAKCAWRDSRLAAASPQAVPLLPEPDDDHPCLRGARESLVDELLGVMDSCKAAGMSEAVEIIRRSAVWIDPDAPIDQEPVAVPSEQPIAEQPQSEQPQSVYLGSAGPSEDLQTALPRWIPVSERMPTPGTECFVWCRESVHGGPYAMIDTWGEQYEAPVSFSTAKVPVGLGWDSSALDHITHWMPILPPGESAGAQPSDKKHLPSMPAASLPVSAPAGQEDARARATDWGLTKGVAMSLKPFLRPGEKVIWREPFRWKDENGVLSNHYESMSLAALAEDFNYEIVEDFKHAAIIRPLAAMSATTEPKP